MTRHTLRKLAAGALAGLSLTTGALALVTSPVAAESAPSAGPARSADPMAPVSATGATVAEPRISNGRRLESAPANPSAPAPAPQRHVLPEGLPEGRPAQPAPERVFGSDDRMLVTDTTRTVAWQTTALIYDASTGGWCTGFMIGPDTVATAGHCVYDYHNRRGWWSLSQTRVYPAYNGYTNTAPFGSCSVRNLYTVRGWVDTGNWDYDYGAIKLNCTIGNRTGWYGLTNGGYNTSTRLTTQGYPSDKRPAYSMWAQHGTITGYAGSNQAQLTTYMDIIPGQSGSPVYRTDANCPRCAIGIVSWESPTVNGINRLTTASVNWLISVRNS